MSTRRHAQRTSTADSNDPKRVQSIGRLGVAAAFVVLANITAAQAPPDYGYEFVTITHPGNRGTIPSEQRLRPEAPPVGQVDHEYRISRTEVAHSQWEEFANAYLQAFPAAPATPELLGFGMTVDSNRVVHTANPMNLQSPTQMSWRMAARYCNWLTNDKSPEPSAFESGAYDASTFTQNSDGTFNDQIAHSPGALFWIPTVDEWTKAAYYDPDRYGPGLEGYWTSPNGTNEPLITGLPQNGGQTNAGTDFPQLSYSLAVGSYVDVQSPWGLFDVSGGVSEWTETSLSEDPRNRWVLGSHVRQSLPFWADAPDALTVLVLPTTNPSPGLRLASAIPAPGTIIIALLTCLLSPRRCRV